MFRFFSALLALWLSLSAPVKAQEFGALARFEGGEITDTWSGAELTLSLSQGVPWRVFSLRHPNRIVLDFREVDWTGANSATFDNSERVKAVRMGAFRPGWSRLVAVLSSPSTVTSAEMKTDAETGQVKITVALDDADQDLFDALTGPPRDPRWDLPEPVQVAEPKGEEDRRIMVVLDPGHGGIDPGALRGETREADLMLTFARELRDVLRRTGEFDVALTREGDYFVSLEARVAHARANGADIFLSLHADALAEGEAHGAAIYTLAEEASDAATAALAERHDRADLLAGVDLSGSDDRVASVLLDIARLDNTPRSTALAEVLVAGIENAVGRVHKRPLRSAGFSVLKAADIPSVLIEVGFLSTEEDLKNLSDPIWRQGMAAGIRDGLLSWSVEDAALAPLRRK